MRRSLLAALALTLTAGLATSACEATAPGQALPGMTMWELIEHSTNPDGTMGLQASLVKFSYLFGTLPGVAMPDAKPDPPGFKVSGTSAINSIRSHWTELTEEQQQAVTTALTPSEPPRLRAQPDPAKDKAGPVLRKEVDRLIGHLDTRLGLGGTIPSPQITLEDQERENSRAWTEALGGGGVWNILGIYGPVKGCLIHFPPSIWKNATGGVSSGMLVSITHEIFHCYQAFHSPYMKVYQDIPPWIGDGSSEFAAMDLLQFSYQPPPNHWTHYLNNEMPLFQRSDAAMGWWFQLQHMGHDPWKLLPPLWESGESNKSELVYLKVGGAGNDMYDTWAASRMHDSSFGGDWEVYGADVPPDKPTPIELPATAASLEVAPVDAVIRKLIAPDDLSGVLRIGAANPIRVHDSAGYEDPHVTEGDYCLGETCTCPEKTERAGEKIKPAQAPIWLAVPGGEGGNSVRGDVISLEEYCRKKQPDRKKPNDRPQPPWAPAHPSGNQHGSDGQPGTPKPASVGDPHLTTLDGYAFDFQTAGEFTLARSDSGDLEVQTRQQPRIKFDGKESDIASMNTAAAARVAGDRVAFYAGQDRPEVRINGTVTPVGNERKLPKGGTIRPVEAGYAVRWADGTEMWVINAGAADSLTVLLGPADSRKGTLHGLLGPFVGKAGPMFSRDGRSYEKPGFDELYKKIGDSWRIKQPDSLFDYQPGQSTETFTRKDLPTKPLTLADLSPEQRAAGEKACAGVTDDLRERCVFDVAVSGNDKFAVGYRTLDKVSTVGGGTLTLNKRVGPQKLEPGQQQSFTISSDADTLYFASDADCPASSSVYWRITMPDGKDTLQVPMCADPGRQTTTKKGTWKIDVWVAPGADQGGTFSLHVAAAGPLRTFDIGLPKTVDGSVRGAGGEDRYKFNASAGDKVTLTAKSPCDSDRSLDWGLESPDGNRVTLRARACEGLGQQTIPTAGIWAVAVYNRTSDENPHSYAFLVSRP
jgi:hypothetical protein